MELLDYDFWGYTSINRVIYLKFNVLTVFSTFLSHFFGNNLTYL